MFILLPLTIIAFAMTVRAFLVVTGSYKDPIFASFETYGTERIFSPMFSLVSWAAVLAYVLLYWYINAGMAFAVGLVFGLPMIAIRESFIEMLYKHHEIFRVFPLWYYRLVQQTDREERRRLAYMWLRLPARTRILYNTHTALFYQWVEQVLVTISR